MKMEAELRAEGALAEDARAVAGGLRRRALSPRMVAGAALALDGGALALGLWLALGGTMAKAPMALGLAAAVASFALVAGAYRLPRLRRFLPLALLLGLPALAAAFASGGTLPALLWVPAMLLPARALAAAMAGVVLDFGLTERRAVLVGGGNRGAAVMDALQAAEADIRVCGVFDDRTDARSPAVVRGVPKLGTVADLVAFVRATEVDLLIVTLPLGADRRIREILDAVRVLPVDVRLSDFNDDPGFRRRGGCGGGSGLVELMSRPLRQRQVIAKRMLDIAGASLLILLTSPILVAAALAVRLDSPGPALFRQPRHGYNHRAVTVWKFRTMHTAACDLTARQVVTKGDPRVTRVGRFLRRSSIDELPQLFNVLTGQLSLVGPRPHVIDAISSRRESFETIVEDYAARHKVRPGVTGWAQIHGWRGEIDDPIALQRRVEHDLWYIGNWSIWLDLYIIAVTPFRLLDTRNAY